MAPYETSRQPAALTESHQGCQVVGLSSNDCNPPLAWTSGGRQYQKSTRDIDVIPSVLDNHLMLTIYVHEQLSMTTRFNVYPATNSASLTS